MAITFTEQNNSIVGIEDGGIVMAIHRGYFRKLSKCEDSKIRRICKRNGLTRREQSAVISYCHKIKLSVAVEIAQRFLDKH